MGIKLRLVVMNFLQYAIWGAYLTSMGSYLVGVGLASHIGIFYAMQGIVSLFMPAVIGIVADRWVPAQRLLGVCHLLAALFMGAAGYYAFSSGAEVSFGVLFTLYSLSVAFYMPTIALSNSVAYCVLEGAGLDTVKSFPPIRVWGTVGFICSMLVCDAAGFQTTCMQFVQCAVLGLALGLYAMTLPGCPVSRAGNKKSLVEALGLRAFTLRQVEGHVSTGGQALSCTCVLVACAVCMICAGLLFSVGQRAAGLADPGALSEASLAPIGYVGIFYGEAFLVAAAAVLALQQVSQAADGRRAYATLAALGTDAREARGAVRAQVGVAFALPAALAVVHDCFGLMLVRQLAGGVPDEVFLAIAVCSVVGTLGLLALYYLLCVRECTRVLLGRA